MGQYIGKRNHLDITANDILQGLTKQKNDGTNDNQIAYKKYASRRGLSVFGNYNGNNVRTPAAATTHKNDTDTHTTEGTTQDCIYPGNPLWY